MPDMGLALREAQLYLEPAVGFLAGHQALLPKLVQGDVGLPPLLPQGFIRQRAHGQVAVPVGGYIGVADRKAGADIDLLAGGSTLMHHRRGPKKRLGAAVGTLDVDAFHRDTFFLF